MEWPSIVPGTLESQICSSTQTTGANLLIRLGSPYTGTFQKTTVLGIILQSLQLTVNGLYKKLYTDKGAVAQLKFKADAGLLLKYRYFRTLSKNTDIVSRRWSDRELSPALSNPKSSIPSTQLLASFRSQHTRRFQETTLQMNFRG